MSADRPSIEPLYLNIDAIVAEQEADCASHHLTTSGCIRTSVPMIVNGYDWGLGDVVLPETTLRPVADKRRVHVTGDVG